MFMSNSIAELVVGRFIVGVFLNFKLLNIFQIIFLKLGVGIAAMIVPIFLAEASTKSIRGAIVTFNILFVTFG